MGAYTFELRAKFHIFIGFILAMKSTQMHSSFDEWRDFDTKN